MGKKKKQDQKPQVTVNGKQFKLSSTDGDGVEIEGEFCLDDIPELCKKLFDLYESSPEKKDD